MTKPKAINRKKLVAFVLPIIRKEKLPMSEELEKLRHKQYVAERKLTAAKHKEKRLQSELKRLTRSERTVVRQINRCFSLQIKTDILMLNAA